MKGVGVLFSYKSDDILLTILTIYKLKNRVFSYAIV